MPDDRALPASDRLVSVIIPCFNQGQFLAEAVNSALGQTYPHVEIIIVDDGSTDQTRQVARGFGAKVKYIYQPNSGPSAARNNGILASSGAFIQFLDSDDRILPDKLAAQVRALDEHPEVGVVYSQGHFIDPRGERLGRVEVNHPSGSVFHELLTMWGTVMQAPLLRRACLSRVGLFDASMRFAEDTELWLRIALHYPFLSLPGDHFELRIWPESSSTNVLRMREGVMRVLKRYAGVHGRCAACRASVREARRRWSAIVAFSMMSQAREHLARRELISAARKVFFVVRHNPAHVARLASPRYLPGKARRMLSVIKPRLVPDKEKGTAARA